MADTNGVLQKFSIFSYEATANVSGRMSGVAIHPNGKISTTAGGKKNSSIQ